MKKNLELLKQKIAKVDHIQKTYSDYSELTIEVLAKDLVTVMKTLKKELQFEQCPDICGIDYLLYGVNTNLTEIDTLDYDGCRFAVIYHLLSLTCNYRLRVKVFADSNDAPQLPSISMIWQSAIWCEREVFDLYGITFTHHPDLRRILTDYGFIGHPLRKDFPLSGSVEMVYDPQQSKVVYRPVSIEMREITPRIIKE